jgi:hypothetical protein
MDINCLLIKKGKPLKLDAFTSIINQFYFKTVIIYASHALKHVLYSTAQVVLLKKLMFFN